MLILTDPTELSAFLVPAFRFSDGSSAEAFAATRDKLPYAPFRCSYTQKAYVTTSPEASRCELPQYTDNSIPNGGAKMRLMRAAGSSISGETDNVALMIDGKRAGSYVAWGSDYAWLSFRDIQADKRIYVDRKGIAAIVSEVDAAEAPSLQLTLVQFLIMDQNPTRDHKIRATVNRYRIDGGLTEIPFPGKSWQAIAEEAVRGYRKYFS